ncbi:acetoacetate- ligase [Lecanosticta acicola]|uniref:Acetoacetate- ligase n=1 Tax=Lecanosticta acicola TaxID=111012 RepID=A0AAI9EFE0_9PEZI|nr:acetoacetate- ligase [Lecanosticta acicola]
MFSMGMTGTPKGIVHSQGGLVINGLEEHLLNYDHEDTAVHYYYAGIGWTLWNIMIAVLSSRATIVLYDGSPFYPTLERRLKLVLATGVTSFGVGPRYFTEFTACQISTSSGTELCGKILHGSRTLPTYAGETALKCLGMDVDVFTPEGKSAPLGEAGELNDDTERKRYRAACFEGFAHVWTHSDHVKIDPDTKGLTILGRSDGVLNPSGIRSGSREIDTVLERVAQVEVLDSICVGQQRRRQDESERVCLFLLLRDEKKQKKTKKLRPELVKRIRDGIQQDLSRRHVPHFPLPAVDGVIPYNANGKKLEMPLRSV